MSRFDSLVTVRHPDGRVELVEAIPYEQIPKEYIDTYRLMHDQREFNRRRDEFFHNNNISVILEGKY